MNKIVKEYEKSKNVSVDNLNPGEDNIAAAPVPKLEEPKELS